MSNPIVGKMLLDKIDTLESENESLKRFRSDYHDATTKAAVLEEALGSTRPAGIMQTVCMGIGGIIIGHAQLASEGRDWILAVCGALLFLAGMFVTPFMNRMLGSSESRR